MKVGGVPYRTIWPVDGGHAIRIIDQRRLPHVFEVVELGTVAATAVAIRDMWVRGAPLIGATAAWGLALAMDEDPTDEGLDRAHALLLSTRPTAVNLRWALDRVAAALRGLPGPARPAAARELAGAICDEDVAVNRAIGEHGAALIAEIASRRPGKPVNVLTHCNAGWLATVDWGTATAPVYRAVEQGIPVHVFVDETRPRNQGASLTAWELGGHGVPHTLVVDNAGGHLMQHGAVDLVIVGTDRTTADGDVCNKIGTYLKALAAHDNGVPFYVALPSSTIDWTLGDGIREIPIEERHGDEVATIEGRGEDGIVRRVRIAPDTTPVANPAFDVTPARLVTGLVTERGIAEASRAGLSRLFPERS
jgi:methylthioribose-1-phosphate isomerase